MTTERIQFDPEHDCYVECITFGTGNPMVAITAGIHGEEHTGIYVAQMLVEKLQNIRLEGTIKILPICNPRAFSERSRCSDYDQKDLNRTFCQEGPETYTTALAKTIWEITKTCDFLLDLHCCGQYGSTYVMSMHEEYDHQLPMATALGIRTVCQSSMAPGQLFVETNKSGRKALLIEIKGGQPQGIIDLEAAEVALKAAMSFLFYAGCLDEQYASESSSVVFHEKINRVFAPSDGLFLPCVHAGIPCAKDDYIGYFNGEPVRAEATATILAIARPQYLFSGERIYTYASLWKGES
jgi:predicted deacylase